MIASSSSGIEKRHLQGTAWFPEAPTLRGHRSRCLAFNGLVMGLAMGRETPAAPRLGHCAPCVREWKPLCEAILDRCTGRWLWINCMQGFAMLLCALFIQGAGLGPAKSLHRACKATDPTLCCQSSRSLCLRCRDSHGKQSIVHGDGCLPTHAGPRQGSLHLRTSYTLSNILQVYSM